MALCAQNCKADSTELSISIVGPATATLGSQVSYTIVVENIGTTMAIGVTVIVYSGSDKFPFLPFDLPAKAKKELSVSLRMLDRGRFITRAVATSSNANQVQAEADIVVTKSDFELSLSCTRELFIGQRANVIFSVVNTGDIELTEVAATIAFPTDIKVISFDCTQGSGERNSWNIGSLPAGTSANYHAVLVGKTKGSHCATITASAAGVAAKTLDCCTQWKGQPALLLEMLDTEDPIGPGDETTYVISITNCGTDADQNIQIVAIFPEEIIPTKVEGPIDATSRAQGRIQGNRVTFPAYPVLQPKQKIKYQIVGKAAAVGEVRVRVELTSENLKKPVAEEESTHVY